MAIRDIITIVLLVVAFGGVIFGLGYSLFCSIKTTKAIQKTYLFIDKINKLYGLGASIGEDPYLDLSQRMYLLKILEYRFYQMPLKPDLATIMSSDYLLNFAEDTYKMIMQEYKTLKTQSPVFRSLN